LPNGVKVSNGDRDASPIAALSKIEKRFILVQPVGEPYGIKNTKSKTALKILDGLSCFSRLGAALQQNLERFTGRESRRFAAIAPFFLSRKKEEKLHPFYT